MQASVHTFDPETGAGSVLRDDGAVLPFSADAWATSGLRHLRVGQRVCIQVSGDDEASAENDFRQAHTSVAELFLVGIGEGQPIL
ncbi:MAG TPA: hypothetical protein VJ976_07785 [Ornithinimicrobium sp.]|uniref:hypothetical protein n=1 Tax=Ornithinimicrobium sp. TaxID=1977084 RepID=UPI002B47CC11|nr:hypothetical protein [Ornithinimicrobium sp.]HKJ12278.1 hypothetical protein [Ornithinimicrobium sp.]